MEGGKKLSNVSVKVWYCHIEKHKTFSPLSSKLRQLPESKKNGSCYYKGREGKSISNGVYDGQIQELFFRCILREYKEEKKNKKVEGAKREFMAFSSFLPATFSLS